MRVIETTGVKPDPQKKPKKYYQYNGYGKGSVTEMTFEEALAQANRLRDMIDTKGGASKWVESTTTSNSKN